MQRRKFFKHAAFGAVAISATGFIQFNGKSYEGDCETTTDILGPFYRPDSPLRSNLVIDGDPGERIRLSGIIRHNDCTTPFKDAKVELWHCDAEGVYDNESDDFRYRGTTVCDEEGRYFFDTVLPVPYDAGGQVRPAHFHMLISAAGYQSLVTQLYFMGDPYIAGDTSAASPTAKRRILEVHQSRGGEKMVSFDVTMTGKLMAEPAAIDKLTGIYANNVDESRRIEFFRKNNQLWKKNEVFGRAFNYIGDNTFQYPGMPPGENWTLHFEISKGGSVKLTETQQYGGREFVTDYQKK